MVPHQVCKKLAERRTRPALYSCVWVQYDDVWERRDVLGVHPQKQEGYSWVGACVPTGRIFAEDFYAFADVADK